MLSGECNITQITVAPYVSFFTSLSCEEIGKLDDGAFIECDDAHGSSSAWVRKGAILYMAALNVG